MPIDGGYEPTRQSQIDRGPIRVMRLGDVDPADQRRIKQAMGELPPEAQPTIQPRSHWYCPFPGARRDFIQGAESVADLTRQPQLIHFHGPYEECGECEHLTIEPTEPRSTAVGGREHRG